MTREEKENALIEKFAYSEYAIKNLKKAADWLIDKLYNAVFNN